MDTPVPGPAGGERRDGPIDKVIGNYRIVRELGRGGMGCVYEAWHLHMDRRVAIKSLLPAIASDQETLQRLFREQEILDGLRHANIVALHDVHVQQDGVYLVMEYIEGLTLEQRIRRAGALDAHAVAAIGQQLLSALAHTHARGVVHRDIKPGNIMLTKAEAKLLDFGIAKAADSARLTAPDMVFGSPAYMPPELWRGKPASPASDLYALALCLYEALVGEPALRSESGWQAYYALHTTTKIPHIGRRVPRGFGWLANAIFKATRPEPARRYRDAKEMLAVFRDHHGMSGEISLSSLDLDLGVSAGRELPAARSAGPTTQLPDALRTSQDSGPTLVRPLGGPRRGRWPWLIGVAGLTAIATLAATSALQPEPGPLPTGPSPQPAQAAPSPESPVPTPAEAKPVATPRTQPQAQAPKRTAPEGSVPAATPVEPPGASAVTAILVPPPSRPRPRAQGPCGSRGSLETLAAAGGLTAGDRACLEAALAGATRQTDKDRYSRFLLVDARARQDMKAWSQLAERHLTDITQSDPTLCFQYASYMRRSRRHHATIKWADRALENKQAFAPADHAEWVTALLRMKALAAHDLWRTSEEDYTETRATRARNDADRRRDRAKTYAKEWYDFAKEAGTSVDEARKVCGSVAGSTALCP